MLSPLLVFRANTVINVSELFAATAGQVADFTKHAASDLTKKVRLRWPDQLAFRLHIVAICRSTCPCFSAATRHCAQLFGGGGAGGSRGAGTGEEGFSISKITEGVSSW